MEKFEKKTLNRDDHKNIERAAMILRIVLLPVFILIGFIKGVICGTTCMIRFLLEAYGFERES